MERVALAAREKEECVARGEVYRASKQEEGWEAAARFGAQTVPWGRSDRGSGGMGQEGRETAGRWLSQKCVSKAEEREWKPEREVVREGFICLFHLPSLALPLFS